MIRPAAQTTPDRLAETADRIAAAHDRLTATTDRIAAARDRLAHDTHDSNDAPVATSDFRAHLANQKWSRPTKAATEAIATPPQQQPQPLAAELAIASLIEAVSSLTAPTTEATAATPTAAPAMNPATMQTQQPALQASDQSDGASSMQLAVDQAADSVKADPPLTPLEQAVHDLVSQQSHHDDDLAPTESQLAHVAPPAHPVTAMPVVAPQPTQTLQPTGRAPVLAPTAIAEPRALPEQAAPSHLHLVLGDDSDRVVMTIAVRGADVNVTLRASDDQTAASLARNAASLDHALRARGLNLSELAAEHDHQDPRDSSDRPAPEREPRDDAQPFVLEEAS